MRSKLIVSFVLLAMFGVGYGLYYLAHHRPASFPTPAPETKPVTPDVQSFRSSKPVERVQAFYQNESARIGDTDLDPKLTEQRLRAIAEELQVSEIEWLQQRALNVKENPDARFFAAYLLALGKQEAALPALKAVALAPMPKSKNDRALDIERQIRGQSIEGLSKLPNKRAAEEALMDVQQGVQDEFLRDRAHRGLYSVATGKPIEEQDREAAGKMLYGK